MKLLLILLVVVCFASFAWGRRCFFLRTERTSRHRGGLGPVGTIFCLLDVTLLVIQRSFDGVGVAIGVACSLASFSVFWWTVTSYEGKAPHIAHTPSVDFALNLRGPYSFVRHPFYFSYMLLWVGVVFLLTSTFLWSLAALVAVIMSALYYRTAVREESEILSSAVREEYIAYMHRTGRFIPKFRRTSGKRKS